MLDCCESDVCETVIFIRENGVLGYLKSSKFSGLAGAAPQGRRGQGASRPARPGFHCGISSCNLLSDNDSLNVHTRQYRKRQGSESYMLRNGHSAVLSKRAVEVGPAIPTQYSQRNGGGCEKPVCVTGRSGQGG